VKKVKENENIYKPLSITLSFSFVKWLLCRVQYKRGCFYSIIQLRQELLLRDPLYYGYQFGTQSGGIGSKIEDGSKRYNFHSILLYLQSLPSYWLLYFTPYMASIGFHGNSSQNGVRR
jgi:hypothetical protein